MDNNMKSNMNNNGSLFDTTKTTVLVVSLCFFYVAAFVCLLLFLSCLYRDAGLGKSVPKLDLDRPDFTAFTDSSEKKKAFFSYIGALADAENRRVSLQRDELISLEHSFEERGALTRRQSRALAKLANEYRVSEVEPIQQQLEALLLRVNIIPRALVQVQAAIESGWGTSRFALEGHNLFGQWCFAKGCGIVPSNRAAGATHEVAVFASDQYAIRAYLLNLNAFRAYKALREARAELSSEALNRAGEQLAATLLKYSERGEAYVHEVQTMIRVNGLESKN